MSIMPLPDGFESSEIENLDFAALAKAHPLKAIVLADYAMKHQVHNTRLAWIVQAQILFYVKESGLWQFHPDGYTSFFSWCQQPEIELAPSVVSDMLAVVRFAPTLEETTGIDLFEVIKEIGHSKVRQLIPLMRDAYRDGTMLETIAPLIDEIKGSSFRDVLQMLNPGGQRTQWDPEVVVTENTDGSTNLTLRNLDYDTMELAINKLAAKRFFNANGYRIESPLNVLPPGNNVAI